MNIEIPREEYLGLFAKYVVMHAQVLRTFLHNYCNKKLDQKHDGTNLYLCFNEDHPNGSTQSRNRPIYILQDYLKKNYSKCTKPIKVNIIARIKERTKLNVFYCSGVFQLNKEKTGF